MPFLAWIERRSGTTAIALLVVSMCLVAFSDYLSGPNINTSVFYLAPVMGAAWRFSRRWGIATSTCCALLWTLTELLGRTVPYDSVLIPTWNGLARTGSYCIVAYLTTTMRRAFNAERVLSQIDTLTGLHNRRIFLDRLDSLHVTLQQMGQPFSILYLDIDRFKQLNDTHGHQAGDVALQAIGHVMREAVRSSDLCARIGGDEFAILLPNTDREQSQLIQNRLLS